MYCFQDGSEVIGIKHESTDTQEEQEKSALAVTFTEIKCEATDTQQEQQNSAVAVTFTEIKGEEEVSCIALYPLLFVFSNILLQFL
jgi:hypothetical protein